MDRASHETNVASAKKIPDFKSIACSGKLLKDAVVHNLELLKTLDSEIKLQIIGVCIKNKTQDYVGLRYLHLYEAHRKEQSKQENHVIEQNKKRKSHPDDEDYIEKKREIPVFPKPSFETLSEDKQENQEDEDYVEEEKKRAEKKKNKIIKERSREIMLFTLPNLESFSEDGEENQEDENYVEEEEKSAKKKKNTIIKERPRANQVIPESSFVSLLEDEQESHYEDEDYIEEEERHAKKKRNTIIKERPRAIPEISKPSLESLPEEIKRKIIQLNGKNINWVYTKSLFGTDVKSNNSRLSMPKNQIDISFLREEEREFLRKREGGIVPEIKAGLVGPTGEDSMTSLKLWEMRKESGKVNYVYNLVENWYKGVVVKYDLKKDDLVQVWSFRVDEDIWFALVRVHD